MLAPSAPPGPTLMPDEKCFVKSGIHLKINSWNSSLLRAHHCRQKHIPLKRLDLQPIDRVVEDLKPWRRKETKEMIHSVKVRLN